MSTRSETLPQQLARQTEPLREASTDLLLRARDGVSKLVGKYPAATVVGAFAVGFALAKLFRSLSED
jgi:hypothetical protein